MIGPLAPYAFRMAQEWQGVKVSLALGARPVPVAGAATWSGKVVGVVDGRHFAFTPRPPHAWGVKLLCQRRPPHFTRDQRLDSFSSPRLMHVRLHLRGHAKRHMQRHALQLQLHMFPDPPGHNQSIQQRNQQGLRLMLFDHFPELLLANVID